jgi:hypothetical protein
MGPEQGGEAKYDKGYVGMAQKPLILSSWEVMLRVPFYLSAQTDG